jgi:hypothetical protein
MNISTFVIILVLIIRDLIRYILLEDRTGMTRRSRVVIDGGTVVWPSRRCRIVIIKRDKARARVTVM